MALVEIGGVWNILEILVGAQNIWRFTGSVRKPFELFYLLVNAMVSPSNWNGLWTFSVYSRVGCKKLSIAFKGAVNIFTLSVTFPNVSTLNKNWIELNWIVWKEVLYPPHPPKMWEKNHEKVFQISIHFNQ